MHNYRRKGREERGYRCAKYAYRWFKLLGLEIILEGNVVQLLQFPFLFRRILVSLGIMLFSVPGVCVITKATYFIYWKECHVLFSSIQSNVLAVVKVPNPHFLFPLAYFFSPLYHLFFQFSSFHFTLVHSAHSGFWMQSVLYECINHCVLQNGSFRAKSNSY